MAAKPPLPKFHKPPVAEVAIGMQFGAPAFSQSQIGAFFKQVWERYPGQEIQPPFPPQFETFSAVPQPLFQMPIIQWGQVPFAFNAGPQNVRNLFITQDGHGVIQLQADRLTVNWRNLGKVDATYPHFEALMQEFSYAVEALNRVRDEEKMAELSINQCEVYYSNLILAGDVGVAINEPHRIFHNWNDCPIHGTDTEFEDLSFNARYRMKRADGTPCGRVHATMQSARRVSDGAEAFQFDLVGRGMPSSPSIVGVTEFLETAREAIVRGFAEMTTTEMHQEWERYQ